jgi:hypothetical protein
MRADGSARDGALLVGLGLLARLGALAALGPQPASDTAIYVSAARTWGESGFSPGWFLSSYRGRNPGYIALLALTGGSGAGGGVTLVFQALLSAMLPALLYGALRRAGGSRLQAWLAAGGMVASYELTRWNGYLLTDATLVAASALTMAAAMLALRPAGRLWEIGTGLGVLLALAVRSTGFAVAAGALGAAILWRPLRGRLAAAVLAALVVFGAYIGLAPELAPHRQLGRNLCATLASGEVFWGDREYAVSPLVSPADRASLGAGPCLIQLAATAPVGVARVWVQRAIVYWMPAYGSHSTRHRVANALLLGVPLGLAIVGARRGIRAIRSDPLTLVPLAWVAAFTAQHALTWVEQDHRFLAPVLPAVYVLAARGGLRVATLTRSWRATVPGAGAGSTRGGGLES